MGNLSNPLTFKPILIHAARDNNCTRDILVSSSMTLYQLHKFILVAFGLNKCNVDYHNFTLANQLESIETSYEIIDPEEIDGFITPVAPGVYIEHTHPHEPLPLFSVYKSTNEVKMTFRMLRDERYCSLDSIPCHEIYYEIQYNNAHHCIHLNLQSVNLPIHFSEEVDLNPKVINRKGQFFNHHHKFQQQLSLNNKFVINMMPTSTMNSHDRRLLHKKIDENLVKNACRIGIEKLIEERKRFLLNQQKECEWVEPSGEKCVYCTLSMQ